MTFVVNATRLSRTSQHDSVRRRVREALVLVAQLINRPFRDLRRRPRQAQTPLHQPDSDETTPATATREWDADRRLSSGYGLVAARVMDCLSVTGRLPKERGCNTSGFETRQWIVSYSVQRRWSCTTRPIIVQHLAHHIGDLRGHSRRAAHPDSKYGTQARPKAAPTRKRQLGPNGDRLDDLGSPRRNRGYRERRMAIPAHSTGKEGESMAQTECAKGLL
uniref:Uncharacterized protein n=1 Tax=Mycena chlorophos TaxID=658473 RepID=A0ABQ0LZV4_MYCCL|nr:predicted protein [Mycena chlorophos]